MNKHKVVIVGAGPAGLRCARVLAENNEDFILLEAKPKFERKICTGFWGITGKTEKMCLSEKVFERKFRRMTISTPFRKIEVKMEKPFAATLDRKKLSECMFKELKKAEGDVSFNSRVSDIGKNHVVVDKEKIYFDYLVGADGSNSIVRRYLKLPTRLVGLGLQYWIKKETKIPEVHFDADRFAVGYGWIAPHKNKTCIGAGADIRTITVGKLKENLNLWCKEKRFDIKKAKFEGAPINVDFKGYKFGNKFLVGDAGGFPSALTGEGIYFAMASGEDVAKTIVDKNHKPELINLVLKIKERHEAVAKTFSLNKTLEKMEYNILLELLKFKFFEKEVIEFVC